MELGACIVLVFDSPLISRFLLLQCVSHVHTPVLVHFISPASWFPLTRVV